MEKSIFTSLWESIYDDSLFKPYYSKETEEKAKDLLKLYPNQRLEHYQNLVALVQLVADHSTSAWIAFCLIPDYVITNNIHFGYLYTSSLQEISSYMLNNMTLRDIYDKFCKKMNQNGLYILENIETSQVGIYQYKFVEALGISQQDHLYWKQNDFQCLKPQHVYVIRAKRDLNKIKMILEGENANQLDSSVEEEFTVENED